MLLFKDQKVLKQIAEQLDIIDINEEALKKVSEEIENKLRIVIKDSVKYCQKFNRNKLKTDDIKFSIKDINMGELLGYENSENSIVQNGRIAEFNNRELDLKQQIVKEMVQFQNSSDISMKMGWLSIGGKIIKDNHNDMYVDLLKQQSLSQKENREDTNQDNNSDNKIVKIQQEAQNILSNEMNNFLNLIIKTYREEQQIIDNSNNLIIYQQSYQFLKILQNISKYSGINNIIPFVVGYLLEEHDQVVYNGVYKKRLILQVLMAINSNQNSNIEFHLHFVIRILVHFITNKQLSLNIQESILQFRDDSGQFLSVLIYNYSIKYDLLKMEVCNSLLEIMKNTLFDYEQNYGILQFFYYMETNLIRSMILPVISIYLNSQQFQQDLINRRDQEHKQQLACFIYNLFKRMAQKMVQVMNNQKGENKALIDKLGELFGESLHPVMLHQFNTNNQLQRGILIEETRNPLIMGLETLI